METITFEHLKEELGIGLAVAICQAICQEMLSGDVVRRVF